MGVYDNMDTSYMDENTDWQSLSPNDYANTDQLDTPDMSGWNDIFNGGNSDVPDMSQFNWRQTGTGDNIMFNGETPVGFQNAAGLMQSYDSLQPSQFNQIGQTLANLFQGSNGKMASTLLGALMEGGQNKKRASAYNSLASSLRSAGDPFGSQRPIYQAELQNAIQNPYSSTIVSAQVNQLQQAQAIKDAAAGRRSNSATSAPALLAAQAQIAQNYINSLMTPAGANISPNLSGYTQAATQGINSGVNGYTSPLASAVGYNQQSSNNTSALASVLQQLLKGE